MKKAGAVVIIVVPTVLLVMLVAGFFVHKALGNYEKVSYDISLYTQLAEEEDVLPKAEELGRYKDLNFKHFHKNMFIYASDAYILKVKYNNDEYKTEKQRVLNNYLFQSQIPINYDEAEKAAEFKIESFDFKILSIDEYNLCYPKKLVFVGVSDKTNEIAYVFYNDEELDYIGTGFEEFFKENCGW